MWGNTPAQIHHNVWFKWINFTKRENDINEKIHYVNSSPRLCVWGGVPARHARSAYCRIRLYVVWVNVVRLTVVQTNAVRHTVGTSNYPCARGTLSLIQMILVLVALSPFLFLSLTSELSIFVYTVGKKSSHMSDFPCNLSCKMLNYIIVPSPDNYEESFRIPCRKNLKCLFI